MNILKKIFCGGICILAMYLPTAQADTTQWINHFDLLSGDPSDLTLTTNSTSSGIGSGLTGVVIRSSSVGDVFPRVGGNKVVQMALNLPPQAPGIAIRGVRICYESTSVLTYVTQTRIAQVLNPPSSASVLMDNATDLTTVGANCTTVPVAAAVGVAVGNGPLLLSLRINFSSITDAIVIRGLGIVLG
jgi:hypothetical protein